MGMDCPTCGKPISDRVAFSPGCRHSKVSPKSRAAVILLAFFFGMLGVHRFYVGKIGTGILMLLTGGGLGIWMLNDIIAAVCGAFTDSEGRVISR